MRILVTGGAGRIGRELVPMLVKDGHDVVVVQRGSSGNRPAVSAEVSEVRASITDASAVSRLIEDVDAVCHLAALMPPATDRDLYDTNLTGTFNLVEAIRAVSRPIRFVFASSDATYGTGWSRRGYDRPIDETVAPRPTNFYGATKVLGEEMLVRHHDLYGLDFVALRFCWVFADLEVLDLFAMPMWTEFMSQEQLSELADSPLVPIILEEGGTPFTEHVVDARDCATAALLALTTDGVSGEAINICGPAPFRYVDVSPLVAERTGRGVANVPLASFHAYAFDTEKAKRLLGFKARFGIEQMLDEALARVRVMTSIDGTKE